MRVVGFEGGATSSVSNPEGGADGKCYHRLKVLREWWPGTELNRRRQPFQGCALPPELPGHAVRNGLCAGNARIAKHATDWRIRLRAVEMQSACETGRL